MMRLCFTATLLLLLYCKLAASEETLTCYTCVQTVGDSDCLHNPDEALPRPVTKCDQGAGMCCSIRRKELIGNPGTAVDFARGCEEECDPDLVGEMNEYPDASAIWYITYCDEPKCNTGLGNVQLGGGGGHLYIPGIKGVDGARHLAASLSVIALAVTASAVNILVFNL